MKKRLTNTDLDALESLRLRAVEEVLMNKDSRPSFLVGPEWDAVGAYVAALQRDGMRLIRQAREANDR
jgi:hypothetical protein